MPRRRHSDFPLARHHVMNRGARKQPIFLDDRCYARFLWGVAQLPSRFGVEIHGYSLMPNHFHLQALSRRGHLSQAMACLQWGYAMYLNRRFGWDGPVFKGRYRNRLVSHELHWTYLLAYLHLNPVRARLVMDINQSRWTSHGAYSGLDVPPDWLSTSDLMSYFGCAGGYREYLLAVRTKRISAEEGFTELVFQSVPPDDKATESAKCSSRLGGVSAAVAIAASSMGMPVADLVRSQRGRVGNPGRLVAGWWLVDRCGFPQLEVAHALGFKVANLSMALRKVRSRMYSRDAVGQLVARMELLDFPADQ